VGGSGEAQATEAGRPRLAGRISCRGSALLAFPAPAASPQRSWERGTNENTAGPDREYLAKRIGMEELAQRDGDRIEAKLDTRPRKRHDFEGPEERFPDT